MIENSDEKSKVLLVDDELNVLRALTRLLRNYDITALTSAEEALLVVKAVKFDLVISDEAHRSLGQRSRNVFEYFIGFKLGLTATPTFSIYALASEIL